MKEAKERMNKGKLSCAPENLRLPGPRLHRPPQAKSSDGAPLLNELNMLHPRSGKDRRRPTSLPVTRPQQVRGWECPEKDLRQDNICGRTPRPCPKPLGGGRGTPGPRPGSIQSQQGRSQHVHLERQGTAS